MNKKIIITKYSLLLINILIYIFFLFIGRNQYIYNISYTKCIIFMILTSLFIFASGMLLNNEKNYKINITIYFILYFLLLTSITFCIGRTNIKFYTWLYHGQCQPFKTIIDQFKYGSMKSILKNVIGNFVMLIPLSFLLMLRNIKYKNIFKQSFIILPFIAAIELFQAFTHIGEFDIDDIILNYLGILTFTFLITRFSLIDKIRNLFFTDFKLKQKLKNALFYLTAFLIIIYDIFLFIN